MSTACLWECTAGVQECTAGMWGCTADVWACTAGVRGCTAGVWGCTAGMWGCTADVWGCTAGVRGCTAYACLYVNAQLVYVDLQACEMSGGTLSIHAGYSSPICLHKHQEECLVSEMSNVGSLQRTTHRRAAKALKLVLKTYLC